MDHIISAACRARDAMDSAHSRPLQPGERVRCFATRETVEVVSTDADGTMVTVRSERDGTVRCEPRASLAPVETCRCGLPRQPGGPCMAGHVEAVDALPPGLTLGSFLACASPREDRVLGVVLGGMVGDVLGAPFEGRGCKATKCRFYFSLAYSFFQDIRHLCAGLPDRFVPGTHMGLRQAGARYGMYTDDTNAALALADALVSGGGTIEAAKVAHNYARFFLEHKPERGLPDSAKKVLLLCRDGGDVRLAAMSSFCFGSFANGAAMRISPLSLVPMDDSQVTGLVSECCASSHVHPEAIDAAVVQVRAARYLLASAPFDKAAFLDHLVAVSSTEAVRSRLAKLRAGLLLAAEDPELTDGEFLETCTDVGFQLYAPDATATAVWFLLRYATPEEALIRCVALGGDCDTTGAILGALLGAAFGTEWIPVRWYAMLENGEWGRDYAIALARRLALVPCARCSESEQQFCDRPLHSVIAKVFPILAAHFKHEEVKLVERYNPAALRLPTTRQLWESLFDSVALDGCVRYDIATCLASFFADHFYAVPASEVLDRARWSQLYDKLEK